MKPLPDDLRTVLDDIDRLVKACRGNLDHLLERRDTQNIRDQVTAISLTRILKYADAFILLARNGYGEPAACILRSIFEGYLWIRWSVLTAENAQAYFNAGKGEGIRLLEKLIGRGLFGLKDKGAGKFLDPELAARMLKDELKESRLPNWADMAKAAGLSDVFVLVYPLLSGMSHGSLFFLGERMERATISPDANWDNIEPFLPLANNFILDSYRVTEQWILNRELRPLPEWASREGLRRP